MLQFLLYNFYERVMMFRM